MLNSHVNIVVWWPDSGDFLPFTLLFPPFLQWTFSCFHLHRFGNKADFYLYAQMLGRYNLMGYLYISPSSLILSLSFLYLIEPYIVEWVAYFHMLQITRVYRLLSFDVWIVVKL